MPQGGKVIIMTILQVKLAVEVAGKGSISSAASELGLAQSNASHALKKLEEELGFFIFRKYGNKIVPTEEGYRFLEQAENMLRADKVIHSIATNSKTTRLRVGVINYTPSVEAFIKFCREKRDVAMADLICVNIGAENGVQRLKDRTLDIVVTMAMSDSMKTMAALCRDYHLDCVCLKQIPLCVRMRRDHPLLQANALDGSLKKFMQLSDYPYVEYSNLSQILNARGQDSGIPFGYSYVISVDERHTRLETIAATNAYSIGCPIMPQRLEEYGLDEVLIDGQYMHLITITRHKDNELPDISRYIELLTTEVETVLSTRGEQK